MYAVFKDLTCVSRWPYSKKSAQAVHVQSFSSLLSNSFKCKSPPAVSVFTIMHFLGFFFFLPLFLHAFPGEKNKMLVLI